MQVVIKFTDARARSIQYSLRRRYKSKANLAKLIKVAIWREVADEAKKELEEQSE